MIDINNAWYITNYLNHMGGTSRVVKIADPKKLQESNFNLHTNFGSRHEKGVDLLFDNGSMRIDATFIAVNQLLHLYSDEDGTYVGASRNKNLETIYTCGFKFSAQFCQQLTGNKVLLTCDYYDDRPGILIIDGRNFRFYHLKK